MAMKKKILCLTAILTILMNVTACSGKDSNTSVAGNMSTTDQPYWGIYQHYVTGGNGGYYYIEKDKVCFMQADGQTTVLCNKADCRHDSQDCVVHNACSQ